MCGHLQTPGCALLNCRRLKLTVVTNPRWFLVYSQSRRAVLLGEQHVRSESCSTPVPFVLHDDPVKRASTP